MKKAIKTDKAPGAGGPYSQAIVHNGVVYVAGQVCVDPSTGELVNGDISVQTARVLDNIKAVLEAAGSGMDKVLKVGVFLKDMGEFKQMNETYAKYFPTDPPARTTVEAARLPRDVKVEIDCIAAVE